MKILQEGEALLKACEDSELSLEWVFTEEQIEYCHISMLARLPICIGHIDLVQVWWDKKEMSCRVEEKISFDLEVIKANEEGK